MQLDDRDIVCQPDYSPLSNAELAAQIEQYADIMSNAPLIDFDLEWITGPARALMARVEAAEAEAQRLSSEAGELFAVIAQIGEILGIPMSTPYLCETVKTRVAELEAASAAQGWRPVTEEPALPDEYYLTDDTLPDGNVPWIVNYYSAAHGWANRCRVWLCPPPLPPAAAEATE